MTGTRDCRFHHTKMFSTENMKLTSSASEQNVYFTYVCLVHDLQPKATTLNSGQFNKCYNGIEPFGDENQEEHTIQVERTKAAHELVESSKKDSNDDGNHETDSSTPYVSKLPTTSSGENSESDNEGRNFISFDNANILQLTKMKWLTEHHEGGPDSSSPSLSPASSSTSSCSRSSDVDINSDSYDDKYLSTILRLDKEHNMFGLSSIAIVGARPSKQKRNKEDEKPVFPQTAIVQVCCGRGCCKHMSKSDLPSSLKFNGCKSCFFDPCGTCESALCLPPQKCNDTPSCQSICTPCPKGMCSCGGVCLPPGCKVDCKNSCFGLKIKINRKYKFEPPPVELTPRSSCILQKPLAARSCNHSPPCVPPSSMFPYLTPCFWPARPSAPCQTPTRCFHNPPCPAARSRRKVPLPPEYTCPKHGTCENKDKTTKCTNEVCPGKNALMKTEIESRFGKQGKK